MTTLASVMRFIYSLESIVSIEVSQKQKVLRFHWHVVPREEFIETEWWLAYPGQIGIGDLMVKKLILVVVMDVSECMCMCIHWAATYKWLNVKFYVTYILQQSTSSVGNLYLADVYYYFIPCYIFTEELCCFTLFLVMHLRSHSFFRDSGPFSNLNARTALPRDSGWEL